MIKPLPGYALDDPGEVVTLDDVFSWLVVEAAHKASAHLSDRAAVRPVIAERSLIGPP
jgi:hypothetical protein